MTVTRTNDKPRSPVTGPPGSWQDPLGHVYTAWRSPWYGLLLRLQDAVTRATVAFWGERGVLAAHLPVTTGSISSPVGLGSDSVPVSVELHGESVYLADSMQFLLEYATRLAPGGAYHLMPSFRGEAPDGTHLNEFIHSEAELCGDLDDVIAIVETYVRALAAELLVVPGLTSAVPAGLGHVEDFVVASDPLPRLTFDEAERALRDQPSAVLRDPDHGFRTLSRQGEHALIERFGGFVWVTDWDELAVPFYQAATGIDGARRARNADLLFGPGEVVGAGQRRASADDVRQTLLARGIAAQPYEWYILMKEQAPLATAGFGLGVERFLCWVLRHDDVRDIQLVPRLRGIPRTF